MQMRLFLLAAFFSITIPTIHAQEDRRPAGLRCEYLVNPLGLDESHPRLSWQLQDARTGAGQQAYSIIVGTDSLEVLNGKGNSWQLPQQFSADQRVRYAGQPLHPFTRYYWSVQVLGKDNQVAVSAVATFETGMMNTANWQGAWISDDKSVEEKAAPYFRTAVALNKPIRSARAYIAAAGLYEFSINGQRVGDHFLDPAYTRFDRRLLYVTYDVTAQLRQGGNALGILLGNGWYNHQSTAVWNFHVAPWRQRPAFCMDLRITYEDGTVQTIGTGRNWKTSTGPLVFNSIYTAEHYDARLEHAGWDQPGFDDNKWRGVILRSAPARLIAAQAMHPIRHTEKLEPVSMKKFSDTNYVFDLGRTIAGVTELTVKAPAGTVIRLRHTERLYANGHTDMSNIDVHYRPTDNTDPFQTDIFITAGKDGEVFCPRFNYKGFQYVEINSSQPIQLTTGSLHAYFMHSDVPVAGKLNSSNPLINKIWSATNNSYLSNLFGYPTDCPQREKNGWTGDAHIASETGLYNYDVITIYEKWMADHRDEQQPNGVLPSIIPTGGWGYEWGNGPDWTSTLAIIPWNVYLFYGDTSLLAACYEPLRRYVDQLTERSPQGICSWGLGDWVPVRSQTPVPLTSTIYYYTDVRILAATARLLGNTSDAEKYETLARKIKDAFNAQYFNKTNMQYGDGTQTALSMALYWGLVEDNYKEQVAKSLAIRVMADSNHLDVGLLGTKAILNALSENGYADLAYQVATQQTFPSWGWWIVNGATTLYENWPIDAQSDISRNHIMFGEIGAWFYKALGGIQPDPQQPGFRHFYLRPHMADGLKSFSATYRSPYGVITSAWTKEKKRGKYTVVIPPGSSATVQIPVEPFMHMKMNGETAFYITKDSQVYFQSLHPTFPYDMKNARLLEITLESGTYVFAWEMAKK